ncbi:dGTP triphosphohydrolase [Proteus faecis]|uniref:deoxyguanosinetriphosphate triphosphohydrolase family protein n=1 Tax=Proteus faecis TaxID=2050967 RepID=UPI003075C3AF
MEWVKLLNDSRRKHKNKITNNDETRYELERDYDRILFCAPTRRLADKTQVFPLEKNDSVRTRLTHSYEVSNLARSIGTKLAYDNTLELFSSYKKGNGDNLKRNLPALLAAIGLAHDLGNPPFGHKGEKAMSLWFENKYKEIIESENIEEKKDLEESNAIINDFINFDGNSQTFRLVTQLQIINDSFGLNLTYATLAALIKYPRSSFSDNNIWKKHGFFYSEKDIVNKVWEETGLSENIRHPLTYIMEACDDIAYTILDAEDTIKKGLASINDLFYFLEKTKVENESNKKYETDLICNLLLNSQRKYDEYSNCEGKLTPYEVNDISMQMFRVEAIKLMINEVTLTFINNHNDILNGSFQSRSTDLISLSNVSLLSKALREFDMVFGYKNKEVLKLEVEGSHYINNLMDMLWVGIHGKDNKEKPKYSNSFFGDYAYKCISENYRRVFESKENKLPILYKEFQLLADAISGMTDSYLISLHNELKPLYDEQFEKKRL